MGNSLCLCRALSIYEFKSDRLLEVLDTSDCSRKQAREAWDDVFDTDFFTKQPDNNGDSSDGKGSAMAITSIETARRNDGGGRFG